MKYSLTLLKFTVIFCFMISGTAMAQGQKEIAPAAVTEAAVPAAVKAEVKPEITKEMNVTAAIKEQLAETKIQRRKRKKQDPILIPYRLNKKTFSLS
jgi:U3 small nucleolar RNA-associated protein 14